MNSLLLNNLKTLESKLQEDLTEKKNFHHHQQRDLVACWPNERAGRESELIELERDIEEIEDALKELEEIIKK